MEMCIRPIPHRNNLSMKMKLDFLSSQQQGYVFYSISNFIDTAMAVQLYYAYVYPLILYGIELYGVASKSIINQLQVTQNKLLRTLTRKPSCYSASLLHNELRVLTVNKIFELFYYVLSISTKMHYCHPHFITILYLILK